MTRYEYKVCPAPTKGRKGPGVKGAEAKFAHGLEQVMNQMGADGWEYQRSDILPSEERQGLTSSHTVYRSVLVFRRALDGAEQAGEVAAAPVVEEVIEEPIVEAPDEPVDAAPDEEDLIAPQSDEGEDRADKIRPF